MDRRQGKGFLDEVERNNAHVAMQFLVLSWYTCSSSTVSLISLCRKTKRRGGASEWKWNFASQLNLIMETAMLGSPSIQPEF